MTTNAKSYQKILNQICAETVGKLAPEIDRSGAFPERPIEALKRAGLMGAVSAAEVGGLGLGPRGAAEIVRRVAQECGSTAMVLCMHYCGASVLEVHASNSVRRAAAGGDHLSTLAFSEAGSRSHFWAPTSTARRDGNDIVLNARKSWITSASKAAAYVWSSKPLEAEGLSMLWLLHADAKGITVHGPFDGLGRRGNDSSPVAVTCAPGIPYLPKPKARESSQWR